MAHPQPGDPAPDFELQGTGGAFRLSEHRGERVLLLFYPGDDTMVCTKQFCSYRDAGTDFDALGVTAVGISGKDVASKEAFAAKHGLTVPLLADADGEVAKLWGVKGPLGTRRATFVIDGQGTVRAAKVHAVGLRYEDMDDLRELVAAAS